MQHVFYDDASRPLQLNSCLGEKNVFSNSRELRDGGIVVTNLQMKLVELNDHLISLYCEELTANLFIGW